MAILTEHHIPRGRALAVAVLLGVCLATPAISWSPASLTSGAADESFARALAVRLSQRLSVQAAQESFSGELLVARGDRVVGRDFFGRAPRKSDADRPNIYPIASVTKTVTAVAILLLAQQGRLALERPLAEFFPELPPGHLVREGRAVTLEDLLSHTSGLVGLKQLFARQPGTEEATVLEMLKGARVAVRPGQQRSYSNEGYVILGEVLRRVSGQPYDLFVREALMRPLALSDTTIWLDHEQRSRLVSGFLRSWLGLHHDRSLRPHRLNRSRDWSGASDGGLYSSAPDLHRFLAALFGGRVLEPQWLATLTGPPVGRWRGLVVTRMSADGDAILWHNGATPVAGYQAFVGFVPRQATYLVVLANVDSSALDLTETVLDAVEGLPFHPPATWTFERAINTFYALRIGLLGAFAGLAWLSWCLKHPRKDRLDDLACITGGCVLVAVMLLEASTWLFATGTVCAVGLSVLILRRTPVRSLVWSASRVAVALVAIAFAAVVVAGVLSLRRLS